ncbi:hypothetical protein SK128_012462 [Halocaridina rubra]|uniref:Ionotropic glutamate receptor L-glutamate and glycine-binding domain-containing protein n=1 Tax=Halocaridina rubra TaxID=373956 RepID=A0AAN8ZV75_HALRR
MEGLLIYKYKRIATLNTVLSSSNANTIILVLCSPEQILDIFTMLRTDGLNLYSGKWFLITDSIDYHYDLVSGLGGLIREGTQVTLINTDLSGKRKIYMARVSNDGLVRMVYKGSWKAHISLTSSHTLMKTLAERTNDYSNMNGRLLTIACNNVQPFLVLGEEINGYLEAKSGYEVKMLQTLSRVLNFTYRVKTPPDGSYGNILPNGSATGLIGMVARGEANFALSVLTVTDVGKYPQMSDTCGEIL